jgi:5-(carboxyamino)imidazole ribonucleotide mutase
MGSESDVRVVSAAADILKELKVPYELTIVSAHAHPHRMVSYAESAEAGG